MQEICVICSHWDKTLLRTQLRKAEGVGTFILSNDLVPSKNILENECICSAYLISFIGNLGLPVSTYGGSTWKDKIYDCARFCYSSSPGCIMNLWKTGRNIMRLNLFSITFLVHNFPNLLFFLVLVWSSQIIPVT